VATFLKCDSIEASDKTQVRTRLHKDIIDEYCEDIKAGAIMPPIDVFREKDSSRTILSRGFHRLYAAVHAERDEIECEVHEGGMHEALIHALGGNSEHGLRRTSADKRNAVEIALKDPQISQMSRQEQADICCVTKRTVQRIANQAAAAEPGVNDSPPNSTQEPSPDDNRAAKPEPTQAETERDELRQANALYKAFPYPGGDALRLDLTQADVADLEYVSTWAAHAVIAYRTPSLEQTKRDFDG